MSSQRHVYVVLPAYNERVNLEPLIGQWADVLSGAGERFEIVVVDDGSTDGSADLLADLAQKHPIRVVVHEVNQGLGATLCDGLVEAAGLATSGDDLIVTMDADNTHPPDLFAEMVSKLEGEGLDVVVASRFRKGATMTGLSFPRRMASVGARILFQIVCPIRGIRDYTCGYRMIRAGLVQRALYAFEGRLIEERGFASTAELLLKLGKSGARCGESPLLLRYDQKGGESKMRVGSTIGHTLWLLVKTRFKGLPQGVRTRLRNWDAGER